MPPTLPSRNSPDFVSRKAILFSAIGAALASLSLKLKPNPEYKSVVLTHAILLALNPGETPIIPPAQEAPADRTDTVVTLFCASSMLCLFAALSVLLAKQCLRNYSPHAGGSLVERCANRQRKFDGLEKWRFDLVLKSPVVMLLIALALLACGACQRALYFYPSVPYLFVPLTVSGVVFYLGVAFAT